MNLVSGIRQRLSPRSLAVRRAEAELRLAEAEAAHGGLALEAAEGDPVAARRLAALERSRAALAAECGRLRAAQRQAEARAVTDAEAEAELTRSAREAEVRGQAETLRAMLAAIDADTTRLAELLLAYRQGIDALFATMQVSRIDPAVPDLVTRVGANVQNALAGRCPGLNPTGPFVTLGADRRPDLAALKSAPEFPDGEFLVELMRRMAG